ncbi:MAG: hypothetical protein K5871_10855 [Lachnospiraceae bacterium]|nr:hypothetical protein [Lachnospiraceae bacterium]
MRINDGIISDSAKKSNMSASGMKKASKAICETLYDAFHASPFYSGCVYLAFYGPDTAPDIREFAENMSIHSEKVFFPVMAGNTLQFFEQGPGARFTKNSEGIYEPEDITYPLDENDKAVILLPPDVFMGNGGSRIAKCYLNFISIHPNIESIDGIAFSSQAAQVLSGSEIFITPGVIITEDGVSRL